jgi:hypothetical protein
MHGSTRVLERLGILSAWVYAAWLNISLVWDVYLAEHGWISSVALAISVSALLLIILGVLYSRAWSDIGPSSGSRFRKRSDM